jgi:hypothetical protein
MRATREGHINTVVDDDSGPAAARHPQKVCTETRQLARFKIAFTNLQHVNASFDRITHLRHQAFAGALPGHFPGKAVAVRDEMQNQNVPSTVGSILETRVAAAWEKDGRELGKARKEVDEPQSADSPADEIIGQ